MGGREHFLILFVEAKRSRGRLRPGAGAGACPHMALRVGDAVRIFGLVSEEGRKINGCEATVLLPGDRCHVKLKSGVKKSVRESNLVAAGEYDSDDGWNVTCVAKRPRLPGSGGGSLATTSTPAAAVQRGYSTSQVFLALTRRFPLVGRYPEIVDALRELERYEIACQGDDHADREFQRCNSEALEYARAAAVVCGLEWSLGEEIGRSGRAGAVALLEKEPYIGKFRAGQIVDLFQTGTCAALTAFRNGDAPISSKGVRRFENEARRSMRHAPEKRALNRVVGISHMCAIELAGGTHRSLDRLKRETGAAPRHVRSVEELRRWPGLVQRLPRSTALAHSLSVHDELQARPHKTPHPHPQTGVGPVTRPRRVHERPIRSPSRSPRRWRCGVRWRRPRGERAGAGATARLPGRESRSAPAAGTPSSSAAAARAERRGTTSTSCCGARRGGRGVKGGGGEARSTRPPCE